ncbi:hypothetical protein [Streptomyces sp. NPDC058307]|uniref:hypothetical protein n=1 Tax=Streptomyces sp. NPDC058307 TaxID=3346439 RepID=UPI0036E059CD
MGIDGRVREHDFLSSFPLSELHVSEELANLFAESAMPLLVVTEHDMYVRFFAQIRTGQRDALFIWCGSQDAHEATNWGKWLVSIFAAGLQAMEASRSFLNNHGCYYQKFWPDMEIEYKITITPDVDTYDLAVRLRNLVGRGQFSPFMWEYRDDFQQWDFDNHLYEIAEPPAEAGYISFIPDSLGTTVVKRKWFTTDAVVRKETKWLGVRLAGNYADHIEREFRVLADFVGAFRRTRFDVSLESISTGNVYAAMIDRCRFVGQNWPDLCQIELEYLHSRTLRSSAADTVFTELQWIKQALRSELDRLGVSYVEKPMSKLTYMKQMQGSTRTR